MPSFLTGNILAFRRGSSVLPGHLWGPSWSLWSSQTSPHLRHQVYAFPIKTGSGNTTSKLGDVGFFKERSKQQWTWTRSGSQRALLNLATIVAKVTGQPQMNNAPGSPWGPLSKQSCSCQPCQAEDLCTQIAIYLFFQYQRITLNENHISSFL